MGATSLAGRPAAGGATRWVAVGRQEAGRTWFVVQTARSPPLGLGPSSTGMYRPRLGVLTAAAHERAATLAECSPAPSGRSTRRVGSTMVLPRPGLMAARR